MPPLGWDDLISALAVREPARVTDEVGSHAAVAVVVRDATVGLEVLFIQRAEHPDDPWSGQMAFPGGRADPGDADLLATAMRETLEETGIDLTRQAELLGRLDEVRAMARMRPVDLSIAPFVFRLRAPVRPRPSEEVHALHWLALDELVSPERRSTMDYDHRGSVLQFPCLRVQELVIWGLTYRMFMGLMERLGLPPATAVPIAAAAADAAAAAAPGSEGPSEPAEPRPR